MPDLSWETGDLANFVQLLNWRLEGDQYVRREGDVPFMPNPTLPQLGQDTPGHLFPREAITLVHDIRSPSGIVGTIVGTPTRLYRYFGLSDGAVYEDVYEDCYVSEYGAWLLIGSGFSPAGHRWEAENINGYVILNNGWDLPVSYRVTDFEVTPLYELREAGIAYVNTIESTSEGILLLADIGVMTEDKRTQVLSGSSPYGRVREDGVDRYQYRLLYTPAGEPTLFDPVFKASIEAGSNMLQLPYVVKSMARGKTVVIVGAGPSQSNLVAQVRYVNGTEVSLNARASVGVTDAIVTYLNAAGPAPGFYNLQGDASAIIRVKEVDGAIVILRDTGILTGRYTGSTERPFEWNPNEYTGDGSIFCPWSLVEVGKAIIYAGRDRFYTFNMLDRYPQEATPLQHVKRDWFRDIEAWKDQAFGASNGLTQETWFFRPGALGLALGIDGRVSQIDRDTTAAGTIRRPAGTATAGTSETWCVLGGSRGQLARYAYSQSLEFSGKRAVFTRAGIGYASIMETCWGAFDDELNDKRLKQLLLHMATQNKTNQLTSGLNAPLAEGRSVLELSVVGRQTPSDEKFDPVTFAPGVFAPGVFTTTDRVDLREVVDAYSGGRIPLHFLNMYFKLFIVATGPNDARVAGHTWHVDRSRDESISRPRI